MRSLALLAALALAPACAVESSSTQDNDLLAHRMQWSRPGHHAYAFTWQQGCFCGPEMSSPIRITVENGQIQSAVYVATQKPVTAAIASGLTTIEGVFDLIAHALEERYETVTVIWSDLGYPSSLFLDVSTRIADEERSIDLSDVVFIGQ